MLVTQSNVYRITKRSTFTLVPFTPCYHYTIMSSQGHPRKRLNVDPFLLWTKLFNKLTFCPVLSLFTTLRKTESIQSFLLQQCKQEYHLETLHRKVVYFHFNEGA